MGTWMRINGTIVVDGERYFNRTKRSVYSIDEYYGVANDIRDVIYDHWFDFCAKGIALDCYFDCRIFEPFVRQIKAHRDDNNCAVIINQYDSIFRIGITGWDRNCVIDDGVNYLNDVFETLNRDKFEILDTSMITLTQDNQSIGLVYTDNRFNRFKVY